MKRYQVSKLAVVKLTYYTTAKSEVNAAKALLKRQEDLDEMQIDFVLALDEIGTSVKELKPKALTRKRRR
jgi:hypothetical protein